MMTSNVSAGYTFTNLGGYTDSAGTVVPSSNDSDGNVSASLRAQRTFTELELASDKIDSWTPFIEGSVSHYFSRQDTFNFGPGLTVTDGNTNGNLQIGTDVTFNNGSRLNLSGIFSTDFSGDLVTYGGNVRFTIPLN